ncbi:MAG: hypothetical protein GX256_00990 [Fretibacterium sp.]|nr:hypothetical protein [Fretibacterium sp.]
MKAQLFGESSASTRAFDNFGIAGAHSKDLLDSRQLEAAIQIERRDRFSPVR